MTEFAAGLRKLRMVAGGRPYRELSRRAHYSSTTLSDAAGGKRLPTLAVTVAYVKACDGDVEEWTRRWHDLARELAAVEDRGDEECADDGRAPYVGLSTYQVGDAEWFHGRERLIDDLVTKVGERRFVTVVGPSGAGKSSLLRAGLLPRLATSGALVALFTPGARPLEECAIQLTRFLARTPSSLTAELADERGLHLLTREAVTAEREGAEVVLVVDQFEEVFTLCRDAEERSRFIAALVETGREPGSRSRIVLGVRADFYPHCLLDAELATVLNDGQVAVAPMTVDELRQAIVQPARLAGCTVEGALVARLVTHAHDRAGALPLLSHALLETWRRRSGTTLTLTGFERAGGIEGALTKTAEAVFGALEERQQAAARLLFLRLVALGEGTRDTKRRVSNGELDADTTAILAAFAEARLIMLSQHGAEITHEALIEAWPRLRSWLVADREGQRIHRQLTEATAIWQDHHRDPGTLLRGTRLAVATDWARQHPGAANQTETTFLDASTTAADHELAGARRRTRVLRGLVALLGVLLVVATTTAIQAVRAQHTATQQRNVAMAINAVRTAGNLASTNPKLAAQLSLAAYRLHPSPTTNNNLIALTAVATAVPLPRGGLSVAAPDGRLVAQEINNGRRDVALFTVVDRKATRVSTMPSAGNLTEFSPDSQKILTVDRYKAPILWDVTNPAHPTRAIVPAIARYSTFSDDSELLLTADGPAGPSSSPDRDLDEWKADATSRIWDISDTSNPRQLGLLPDSHVELALFADSREMVVTISSVRERRWPPLALMLWDIRIPTFPQLVSSVEMGWQVQSSHATLSADERTLYIYEDYGRVAIWDVGEPTKTKQLASIVASGTSLDGLISKPDGNMLVTNDSAGMVTFWDTSTPSDPSRIHSVNDVETIYHDVTFTEGGNAFQGIAYPMPGSKKKIRSLIRWLLGADLSANSLCEEDGFQMSIEDWDKYFPGMSYRPLCV